jgi:hypothetical protein
VPPGAGKKLNKNEECPIYLAADLAAGKSLAFNADDVYNQNFERSAR